MITKPEYYQLFFGLIFLVAAFPVAEVLAQSKDDIIAVFDIETEPLPLMRLRWNASTITCFLVWQAPALN